MADVIVTYLSYGVFDTQVSTFRVRRIDGGNTPSKVIESVTAVSRNAQSLATKLLAHRKRLDFDLGKSIAEELAACNAQKHHDFEFLQYARQWCLAHICAIGSHDMGFHVTNLLPPLLDRNPNGTIAGPAPSTAFMMAVDQANEGLLNLLIQSPSLSFINCRFDYQCDESRITTSPMALAVCKGHERIIQMLQETEHLEIPSVRDCLATPSLACHALHTGSRSLTLLKNFHWATHICQSGRNRLANAIWRKDMGMVYILLKGQNIDINTGGLEHLPIREAVATSNAAALIILVESGRIYLTDIEIENLKLLAKRTGFEIAISILDDYYLELLQVVPSNSPDRLSISGTNEIEVDLVDYTHGEDHGDYVGYR
jgi:hypothetical protein